ncbi:MAG: glutamine synthetase family protein [Alphaproteobacteria bacterium]|nr:glutamine synthetase family protein [Alphaproteobacteria bacterium]
MSKPINAPAGPGDGGAVQGSREIEEFRQRYPDIRHVDAIFIDMCGIARGKRLPVEELPGVFSAGLNLPASIYLLDATGDQLDVLGRGFTDGDPDGTGVPIAGTLVPAPFAGPGLGQVLMRLREPMPQDIYYDPRNILAAVVERFTAMGLTPVVACELEFYLIDMERDENGAPQPPRLPGSARRDVSNQVYSLEELDYYQAFMDDLQNWSAAQGVPATMASAEFGPAQFEINLRHRADALRAADDAALLRRLVKAAAQARGMEASFMSKPYPEKAGSGLHVHVSVLDAAGRNIFDGDGDAGSAALRHAIGGVRQTMAQSMAIFAPSLSAFRRFGPNIFVPLSGCWGYNNRSVAVRVPSGPGDARRLEHRVAGADANPYLCVAAILAGMHHGVTIQADPGPPVEGNAGTQIPSDLPQNIWAALEAMAAGNILPTYFPGNYAALYVDAKRRELDKFLQIISPQEYAWYL